MHASIWHARWYDQIANLKILDKKWYLQINNVKGVQKLIRSDQRSEHSRPRPCCHDGMGLQRYERLKDNGVTTLTFWGHVMSSVTWPFDSQRSTSYEWSKVTTCLSITVITLTPVLVLQRIRWRYGRLKFFQECSSRNTGRSWVGRSSILHWSPIHKHCRKTCRKTCHKIIITRYLRCHKIILRHIVNEFIEFIFNDRNFFHEGVLLWWWLW